MVSPNRWGRGITNIWAAAHAGALKSAGHEAQLFDATFYQDWTLDEIGYNTQNLMYKEAGYKVAWSSIRTVSSMTCRRK